MESKLDKKKLENTRKVRDSKKMCRSIGVDLFGGVKGLSKRW